MIAFDKDPQAESSAGQFADDPRFEFVPASFADISDRVAKAELDGILLDLGVSSPQLDNAERGFGFSDDGPLDMRMDTRAGITAAEWLARLLRRILQMSSRLTARSGLLSDGVGDCQSACRVTDNADKAASHYCGGGQPQVGAKQASGNSGFSGHSHFH